MKFGIIPVHQSYTQCTHNAFDYTNTTTKEYQTALVTGDTVRKHKLSIHQLRMSTDSLKLKDYYDTLSSACTALDIKASSWSQLEQKLGSYQDDIFLHPSFSNESHHTSLHDSSTVQKQVVTGYKYICTTTINNSTTKTEQVKFKQSPVRQYGDSDDTRTVIADTFTSNFLTASVTVSEDGKYISDDIPESIIWCCDLVNKPKLTAKPHIAVKENKNFSTKQKTKEKIKWGSSTKHASRVRLPYNKAWIGSFQGNTVVLGQDSEHRICIQLRTGRETYQNIFYLLDASPDDEWQMSTINYYPHTSLEYCELHNQVQMTLYQFDTVLEVINHYWGLKTSPFSYVVTTRKQLHANRARNKRKRPDKRTRQVMKQNKSIDLKTVSQAQLRAKMIKKK